MINVKTNVSPGIADCSLYNHRIALNDDYHKTRDMLAYTPVEYISWRLWQRRLSSLPDKKVYSRKHFQQGSSCRIAMAKNKNSAITGSYTDNPFWYQQFDLRQIRILRGGQSMEDFDAADDCRLNVTTMKAMNFQDEISLIPNDKFKYHYVLVFELTSMQDATEHCHYPEIVREPETGANLYYSSRTRY